MQAGVLAKIISVPLYCTYSLGRIFHTMKKSRRNRIRMELRRFFGKKKKKSHKKRTGTVSKRSFAADEWNKWENRIYRWVQKLKTYLRRFWRVVLSGQAQFFRDTTQNWVGGDGIYCKGLYGFFGVYRPELLGWRVFGLLGGYRIYEERQKKKYKWKRYKSSEILTHEEAVAEHYKMHYVGGQRLYGLGMYSDGTDGTDSETDDYTDDYTEFDTDDEYEGV